MVGRLQPSQHKEFPFFWQKKKDEILKAWLEGCCIYIFPFCSALCCSETAASQSRRDARLQERAGSGAEARQKEEDCLRWVDFRAQGEC